MLKVGEFSMKKINITFAVFAATFCFANTAVSKTIVTWWNYNQESSLVEDMTTHIQDKFNASQDEIELQIFFKGEDVNQPTRTALLAGAGPDIITSSGSTYVRAYYDGGFLKSLEEYSVKYGWKDNNIFNFLFLFI